VETTFSGATANAKYDPKQKSKCKVQNVKVKLNSPLGVLGFLADLAFCFALLRAIAASRFSASRFFPMLAKRLLRSCFLRAEYRSNVAAYRDHGQDAHATSMAEKGQGVIEHICSAG
jgi:hypothetical protein